MRGLDAADEERLGEKAASRATPPFGAGDLTDWTPYRSLGMARGYHDREYELSEVEVGHNAALSRDELEYHLRIGGRVDEPYWIHAGRGGLVSSTSPDVEGEMVHGGIPKGSWTYPLPNVAPHDRKEETWFKRELRNGWGFVIAFFWYFIYPLLVVLGCLVIGALGLRVGGWLGVGIAIGGWLVLVLLLWHRVSDWLS